MYSLNFHLNCADKLCRACSDRVEKFERGARRQTAVKTTEAREARQESELKELTMGKRERICQASGVKKRVVINRKTGLRLKTLLGVSWHKFFQL